MGPASGPSLGGAELAARGGWGTCDRLSQGVGPLPRQGGALTATRPKLYGLPFLFLLWHRRRSPFCSSHVTRYAVCLV